jgi:hypothetical protein
MSNERDKKPVYLQQVKALLPMAAMKAAIDIPEGMIDKMVESAVAGNIKDYKVGPEALKALKSRGSARAIGHLGIASLTGPIYMSGMADLKSGDPERRKRGYAKILATGGALGGGKAAIEALWEGKPITGRALARMGTSIASSIPMAIGVAKGEKERSEGVTGPRKYLYPAVGGALTGLGKGGLEGLMEVGFKKGLSSKGFRPYVLAPAAGRAAAGAVGGAVLGELVHHFSKKVEGHEKKSAVEPVQQEQPLQIPGMKPEVQLLPHQQEAIEKLLANRGTLVMAHATGSGKSISTIASQKVLKQLGHSNTALVLVPTALRKNYAKNLDKFVEDPSYEIIGGTTDSESTPYTKITPGKEFYIVGYELFARHPEIAQQIQPDTMILDEYHRVRNPSGATYEAVMSVRPNVKNFIGVTGSVVNNDPSDLAPLVSLASGNRSLTASAFKRTFERRVAKEKGFFGGSKPVTGMQNIPQLQQRIGPMVDVVGHEIVADKMPKKELQTVEVPMSAEQEDYYNYTLSRLDPITAWKIKHNLSVPKDKLNTVFSQLMHARQVSNSLHTINPNITPEQSSYMTPKAKKVLDDTAEHLRTTPDGQVVLYSNLVRGGVDVLAAGLKARGIPYGIFVGKDREVNGESSSDESRNKAVDDYMNGRIKAIVLSGAGAEGLDLKNTTMVQMYDGHFNPERILQAEARGIRIGGQEGRPPEQRKVAVKRYVSALDQNIFQKLFGKKETSVDEWIYSTAGRKASLNRTVMHALKTAPERARPNLQKTLLQSQQTQQTDLPKQPTYKGTELPKDFTKKYSKRYRTPKGDISYEYTDLGKVGG